MSDPENKSRQSELAPGLEQLRQNYRAALSQRIDELQQAYQPLKLQAFTPAAAEGLRQLAHKLAGSGEAFGFPDISAQAHLLLEQLAVDPKGDEDLSHADWLPAFEGLIKAMQRARVSEPVQDQQRRSEPAGRNKSRRAAKLVYVVDSDAHNAEFAALIIRDLGYQVETYSDPGELIRPPVLPIPSVIVMGTLFPKTSIKGLEFLPNLRAGLGARVPVIFLSASADAVARLRAFRAGGDAYVQKPADPEVLSQLLDSLAGVQGNASYKVLFCCQDGHQGTARVAQLIELGHSVLALGRPLQGISLIRAFDPDCIVCTRELNGCSADELVAKLRRRPEFMCLPFLFLDSDQTEGSGAGADRDPFSLDAELLNESKSDLDGALEARVFGARRLLHKIAEITRRDSKTGMVNRRFFWSDIEQAVAAAGTSERCQALIHVTVADSLSASRVGVQRLPGDASRVFNHCLRAILSKRDNVAKLTERVYGVLTSARSSSENLKLAHRICNALESVQLSSDTDANISLSCSAGVAQITPQWRSIEEIFEAAEAAAEQASLNLDEPVILAQGSGLPVCEIEDQMVYRSILPLNPKDERIYLLEPRFSGEDGRALLPGGLQDEVSGSGFMPQIDLWMLSHLCNVMDEVDPDTRIIVTLSTESVASGSMTQWLADAEKTMVTHAPGSLILALPEQALAHHGAQASALLAASRKCQLGLAINYFGATINSKKLLLEYAPDFAILDQQASNRIDDLSMAAGDAGTRIIASKIDDPLLVPQLFAQSVDLFQSHFVDHATDTIFHRQFFDFVA